MGIKSRLIININAASNSPISGWKYLPASGNTNPSHNNDKPNEI
jgi:hypothetical protein